MGAEGAHVTSWVPHFQLFRRYQTQPVPEHWTRRSIWNGPARKASPRPARLQNSRVLSIRWLLLSAKFSGVLRGFASQTALSYA